MKYFAILILLLLTNVGCKTDNNYTPQNLTKVTEEQLLVRAQNHDLPNPTSFIFKNTKGIELPLDSLQKLPNPESFTADYYQNESGEIMEAVLRKANKEDLEFLKKLDEVVSQGPIVKTVDINCDLKKQMLNDIHDKDQGMRKNEGTYDPIIEHQNLEQIVSFIEKCGLPTLDEVNEKEMSAIWLVLQHAPPKYQSQYIPILEGAANRGDLEWEVIALMKDRALMYEGKPQIYGSQVSSDELYDLFEPEFVNQRRAEMGMEPLEEYLEYFGIEFTVKQMTK